AESSTEARTRSASRLKLGFRHSHILVRSSIIEEIAVAALHHSLDKNNVGHRSDLFPFFFRSENRLVGSRDDLARVFAIENNYTRAVDKLVVRPVVNQYDALLREKGWGTGLNHARIEHTRSARKDWCFGFVGPVQKVG